MKMYKATILRFGRVLVQAETESEAKEKAGKISEQEIYWLTEEDGFTRLVSLVEPCEQNERK